MTLSPADPAPASAAAEAAKEDKEEKVVVIKGRICEEFTIICESSS